LKKKEITKEQKDRFEPEFSDIAGQMGNYLFHERELQQSKLIIKPLKNATVGLVGFQEQYWQHYKT